MSYYNLYYIYAKKLIMKKYLILLLVVAFGFVKVMAEDQNPEFTVDGVQYEFDTENSTVIVGENSYYNGTPDLVIPATVMYNGQEYPVTKFVRAAFFANKVLMSVTIPNTIERIELQVFSGCDNLKSVKLPSTITSIGNSAFDGCSALKSIIIPESVTEIGTFVFNNCSNLEYVICNGATPPSLGYQAFYGCSSLSSILVHKSSLKTYKKEWSTYADIFTVIEISREIGGKALLGSLGEEQAGPAVEVIDKDGAVLILFNPKSVRFIHAEP